MGVKREYQESIGALLKAHERIRRLETAIRESILPLENTLVMIEILLGEEHFAARRARKAHSALANTLTQERTRYVSNSTPPPSK